MLVLRGEKAESILRFVREAVQGGDRRASPAGDLVDVIDVSAAIRTCFQVIHVYLMLVGMCLATNIIVFRAEVGSLFQYPFISFIHNLQKGDLHVSLKERVNIW